MEIELQKIFEIVKNIIRSKIDLAFLLTAVLVGVFLDWSMAEIIIFAIFVGIILHPVSSRYLAIPALFFLTLTPFLLILKRDARAEEFAIYAYYFLIMAVAMGVHELRQEKEDV